MINVAFTGHRIQNLYGGSIYSKKYDILRDKLQEVFSLC